MHERKWKGENDRGEHVPGDTVDGTEGKDLLPRAPGPSPYQVAEKSFTERELAYWGISGITVEVLHRYGVVSLRRVPERDKGRQDVRLYFNPGGTDVRLQGEMGREGVPPVIGSAFRLWRSYGRQLLFRSGTTALEGRPALPHGWREGRDDACGSRFPSICFNSETSVIPAKTVRKLVYRFKHIVLLYDTDKTGLECSEKHRYNCRSTVLNGWYYRCRGRNQRKT